MDAFTHTFGGVSGFLLGLFVGLLPFALIAMLVLAQLDPQRKGPRA